MISNTSLHWFRFFSSMFPTFIVVVVAVVFALNTNATLGPYRLRFQFNVYKKTSIVFAKNQEHKKITFIFLSKTKTIIAFHHKKTLLCFFHIKLLDENASSKRMYQNSFISFCFDLSSYLDIS